MTILGPRRATTAAGPSTARTLHLIDIENLVGSGHPATGDVNGVHAVFEQIVTVHPDDLVVIGAGPAAVMSAYLGWAGARYVLRSGPDGADLALLEVIAQEDIARRFTSVTIASGDGIFTDAVVTLTEQGCHVTVVARKDSLSHRLRLAAREIVYLPTPEPSTQNPNHKDAA